MSEHEHEQTTGADPAPEAPRTGDDRVDQALQAVSGLDDVPVDEHAEHLTAAHGALQEVLRPPSDPQP